MIEVPTIDVSSKEFYGEGYDDSDKRIPDMTIIKEQLGQWMSEYFRVSIFVFDSSVLISYSDCAILAHQEFLNRIYRSMHNPLSNI